MTDTSAFGATRNALNRQIQSQFGGPTTTQIDQTDDVDVGVRVASVEQRQNTDTASRVTSSGETSAAQRANLTTEDVENSIGGAQFESNILSTYDNPTYNFRLFITKENAEHDSIATEDIIVIAETGSTGFNIQDVNIATTISPGGQTKNTIAELIKFKILEPHGNRLFDQIRNAALRLGIFDHRTAPMWLQLTFKGYTDGFENSHEGGIPSESNQNDNLNNIQLLWKIKVTDVEIEIDKGGTVYDFTTTPSAHTGLKDDARRLEKDEKIEAGTLGEYFTTLAKRLNSYDNYALVNNIDITKRVRRYAFAFPDGGTVGADIAELDEDGANISSTESDDMRTWTINNPRDDLFNIKRNKNPFAGTIVQSKDKTKSVITFSAGTPIEAIIQEVIGATMEGQSLAINGTKLRSSTDAGEDTSNRKANVPATIFMVDPIVDYLSYNNIANLYNLLITYHIKPYKTFKPLINRKQIEEYRQSDDRLRAILQTANLRKRYDYIFTGLNTEVLDYKIHFQNAWFVALPLFQGQNKPNTAASSEFNSRDRKSYQIVQQLTDNPANSEDSLNNAINAGSDTPEEEPSEEEIARSLAASEFAEEQRNQTIALGPARVGTSRFGVPGRPIRLTTDIQSTTPVQTTDIQIIGAESARTRVAERRAESRSRIGNGSIFFIEDFEEVSVGADISKKITSDIITVSTELGPTTVPYQGNIDTTATKGRSYFSAIMNQMYGAMSDMVELEMTIRGDPYWLGEPDPQKRISIQATGSRDLTNSDVYILMTFGFPVDYDDGGPEANIDSHAGTGLARVETRENGFNGIYRVVRVENEFSGGKFIQKLQGNIDPVTREQDVIRLFTKDNI